jgi:hypothetical protein
MIVPDGRMDLGKLEELLGNPEETHLDLKAEVDLDSNEGKLKFTKDVVTMSNRPPGGYVLVGVDDDGEPCTPIGMIDRSRFDGARLGGLVRGYIEGEIHLSVRIHEYNGKEIVMIFVPHHRDRLPVPFSKDGQYEDQAKNKMLWVFREGEIWVREGAENVRIRHSHWPDLLSEYAKQIRAESLEAMQELLREVVNARKDSAETGNVPLLMDMDERTFADAAVALLEAGNDVRLRQFIRSISRTVSVNSTITDYESALDKWVIFSAQALLFERDDLVEAAIEKLCDVYGKLDVGTDADRRRLAVVIRLYVLGSLAVRQEAWETVHSLALRPVPSNPYHTDYIFSSWIRHAQVYASRARLIDDRRGGLLSAARELMADHPAMRPDLGDDEIPAADEVDSSDVLLNSLCEFDIAYCLIVFAEGTHHGSAYPSSAAFDEDRALPMTQRIVGDENTRRQLFPQATDVDIARALVEVYERSIRESGQTEGSRWSAMPQSAVAFVNRHPPVDQ